MREKKTNLDCYFTLSTIFNLRQMINLNKQAKTLKLLEHLCDLRLRYLIKYNDKLNFIKTNNF